MNDLSAPAITTIIPTYRRPELLRRAILSALAQTGVSLQVCVYDNASCDSTSDVVAELATGDPRLKYFCHERNIGGMANFQYGLSQVRTPFFSFLSDDDVLLPGFYEAAINGLNSFPQAGFWCGVTLLMSPGGALYGARAADWPREGLFNNPEGLLQMIRSMPGWTSVLFRRSVTDRAGPLNETLAGPSDIEFMLRIAVDHPIVASKHPSAVFLLNPQSFSELQPFESFWPGWQTMIESLSHSDSLSPDNRVLVEQGLRSSAQRMLFRRGAAAIAKGDYHFSRKAAGVLTSMFDEKMKANLLRGLTDVCSGASGAQTLYTAAYRAAEQAIVHKRVRLKKLYARYARYL